MLNFSLLKIKGEKMKRKFLLWIIVISQAAMGQDYRQIQSVETLGQVLETCQDPEKYGFQNPPEHIFVSCNYQFDPAVMVAIKIHLWGKRFPIPVKLVKKIRAELKSTNTKIKMTDLQVSSYATELIKLNGLSSWVVNDQEIGLHDDFSTTCAELLDKKIETLAGLCIFNIRYQKGLLY